MNLSGKKTRTGRISGECCFVIIDSATKGESQLSIQKCISIWCNFQVQGQGIPQV